MFMFSGWETQHSERLDMVVVKQRYSKITLFKYYDNGDGR
jgi:hypothetical protein